MHADLSGKYVQFAMELGKPQAMVNYLWYTGWADGQYRFQATERAAQSLGIKLRSRGIGDIAEANDVLAAMKTDEAATVIIQSSPLSRMAQITPTCIVGLLPTLSESSRVRSQPTFRSSSPQSSSW
jgi:hypothetical protein